MNNAVNMAIMSSATRAASSGGASGNTSFLEIILVLMICCYMIQLPIVFLMLLMGDYKNKKEFYLDLVPFAIPRIVKQIKNLKENK